MKKKILFLTALYMAVCTLFASAANDKNIIKEERVVAAYSQVSVSMGIELVITKDVENIVVQTSRKLISRIVTKVEGGKLKLSVQMNGFSREWRNKHKITVYIPANDYSQIEASSGALVKMPQGYKITNLKVKASSGSAIYMPKDFTTRRLDLNVSSGSTVKGEAYCQMVNISTGSGSNVQLAGSALEADIATSSGSSVSCIGLKTDKVRCNASSGSSISIHAVKEIAANISSGGSVKYKGSAAVKSNNTASGGSFKKID